MTSNKLYIVSHIAVGGYQQGLQTRWDELTNTFLLRRKLRLRCIVGCKRLVGTAAPEITIHQRSQGKLSNACAAASSLLLSGSGNAHPCIAFLFLALLFDARVCLKMPPHCGAISAQGARTSHTNDTASITNAGELSVANDDAAGPHYLFLSSDQRFDNWGGTFDQTQWPIVTMG
jgi:hypothetical protein